MCKAAHFENLRYDIRVWQSIFKQRRKDRNEIAVDIEKTLSTCFSYRIFQHGPLLSENARGMLEQLLKWCVYTTPSNQAEG